MISQKLKNKTAVITGGGSGIGQAIALRFASEGAHVVILELTEEKGEQTVQAITDAAGSASVIACDVSNHAKARDVISDVFQKRGKIDILVNNAGVAHVGNLEKTSEADMDRLFAVNVKGVYNCMHAAIEGMVQQGGGVILNMASVVSKVAVSDRFAYSMTKGAVLTMTYSVARDYVEKKIRCNCICPARVHTPFVDGFIKANYPGKEDEMFRVLSQHQPIGRMAKPEEVANLALFLCSDESSFITGGAYDLDGGVLNLR